MSVLAQANTYFQMHFFMVINKSSNTYSIYNQIYNIDYIVWLMVRVSLYGLSWLWRIIQTFIWNGPMNVVFSNWSQAHIRTYTHTYTNTNIHISITYTQIERTKCDWIKWYVSCQLTSITWPLAAYVDMQIANDKTDFS